MPSNYLNKIGLSKKLLGTFFHSFCQLLVMIIYNVSAVDGLRVILFLLATHLQSTCMVSRCPAIYDQIPLFTFP